VKKKVIKVTSGRIRITKGKALLDEMTWNRDGRSRSKPKRFTAKIQRIGGSAGDEKGGGGPAQTERKKKKSGRPYGKTKKGSAYQGIKTAGGKPEMWQKEFQKTMKGIFTEG